MFGRLLNVHVSGPPDPGFHQQAQTDSEDNESSCMDWDKYEEIVAAEEQKQSKRAKCPFIDDEAVETSDYSDCEVVIKKKRAQRLVSYSDSSSSVIESKMKKKKHLYLKI